LTVLVTGPKDEEGELHPFIIRTDENTVSFIAITQQAPPEICKIDDPVRLTPASRTVPLPVEKRPTTADAVAALALEPAKVPSLFITASDATPRMPADDTGVVVMPAGLGKTEVTHAQAQAHSCLVPPTVPVSTAPTDTITDIKLEPAKDLASDAKRHLLTADDTGVSVVQAGWQVTHAHAQTQPCLVVPLSTVTTDTITHVACRRTSRLATSTVMAMATIVTTVTTHTTHTHTGSTHRSLVVPLSTMTVVGVTTVATVTNTTTATTVTVTVTTTTVTGTATVTTGTTVVTVTVGCTMCCRATSRRCVCRGRSATY
jgi:hypothetical protein